MNKEDEREKEEREGMRSYVERSFSSLRRYLSFSLPRLPARSSLGFAHHKISPLASLTQGPSHRFLSPLGSGRIWHGKRNGEMNRGLAARKRSHSFHVPNLPYLSFPYPSSPSLGIDGRGRRKKRKRKGE